MDLCCDDVFNQSLLFTVLFSPVRLEIIDPPEETVARTILLLLQEEEGKGTSSE